METIFLKNVHFLLFDQWFSLLSEAEQLSLTDKDPGLESYLGLLLKNEIYDEEKGFEFEIVDSEKWNKGKEKHDFLQSL
jgi:hypothetical protein